jgi:hypothetical protein
VLVTPTGGVEQIWLLSSDRDEGDVLSDIMLGGVRWVCKKSDEGEFESIGGDQ